MPWIYHQSTGELYHDEQRIGRGWAGRGAGKNTPGAQALRDVGPLPRGSYTVGHPFDYRRTPATPHGTGRYSMRLTPAAGNQMYGRSGFLIHGPSANPTRYGQESNGCIILLPALRHRIGASSDNVLDVVQ